ncbi:MAG: type II secretion system protein [Gemmataceae bacterium]
MYIRSDKSRPGFTLVEVIVVITILSILFALAAGAVFRAQQTAYDMKAGAEIQQIATGIENFKQKYGVGYMPSQLVLKNALWNYNTSIPIERESKKFLLQMFPRIATQTNPGKPGEPTFIGWTGDNNPTSKITLNGCECLVFFLGGRVISTGTTAAPFGFTSDPVNPWPDPTSATPSKQRGSVSFEFDVTRLMISPFNTPLSPINPATFVYLDSFASGQNDMPYFYFSSYKSGNDYNPYGTDVVNGTSAQVVNPPASWTSISPFQIAPFMNSQNLNNAQNRFHNPNGFQLISAGKNKRVGNFQTLSTSPNRLNCIIWENGDFLTPANTPIDRENEAGDDLSNFHGTKLGTPQ